MRSHLAVLTTSALLASGCFLDRAPLSGSSPTDAGHEIDAMVRLDGGSTPVDGGHADAQADAQMPRDSGPGDSGPRDAGCSPAGATCTGDELVRCAPDGTLSRRTCNFGCASTGDRCARPLPSNVGPSFVSDTAGPLVLSGTFDTTGCPGGTPVPQTSGPALCVLSASTVDVPSSLVVSGDKPLVIVATGAVMIEGDIDISARGTTPGPGGANGGVRASTDGEGLSPGIHGGTSSNNADGGGGGGGLCGAGGDGGTGQSTAGGAGGAAVSGWDLSPLRGGSGGGWARGAAGTSDTPDTSAPGGAGGGALQIFSAVSITLDATILAGGGGGRAGLRHPDSAVNYGAGGGGGSGGAVLLEAPAVMFGSAARITTTGGGGGGAASDGGDGDPGEDGADAGGRADGGSSGGSRYGAAGGGSGADDTPDGQNGHDNTGGNANGGGGGGGVGCILVRTLDGALPSGTGAFSPSVPDGLRAAMIRIQ